MGIITKTLTSFINNRFEKKSAPSSQIVASGVGLLAGLFRDDWSELYPYLALQYYKRCSPVFTAINLLSDEFCCLQPVVWDKKAKKYIDDHPVLELLDKPYADVTWEEFAKELAAYYCVTGNAYLIATGNVRKPPKEIYNSYPAGVTILPSPVDGWAWKYLTTNPYQVEDFIRNEMTGDFRFYNHNGDLATATKELWQIKTFNPRNRVGLGYYGLSPLTAIYYEITQHIDASLHNIGLLENGARLSAVFETDNVMTDDQYKRLKKDIDENYKGVLNSGKISLLENGLKLKEAGVNNKDMDFLNLKKENKEAIFNALKIPLALMSVEKATMNNMDKSILSLYDNAVIPLGRRLTKELSRFLMPRYNADPNLMITFRTDLIPAIQARELEITTAKQKLNAFWINEIRAMQGADPVKGGDNIFLPNNVAPITLLEDAELPPSGSSAGDGTDVVAGGDSDKKPASETEDEDRIDAEGDDSDNVDKIFNDIRHLKFKDGSYLFDR